MDTKDNSSVPAAGISRREFVTAGAAVAAALTAPTILGATSKSGTQLPIMGEGEYVFEVQHDWGQDNLPAGLRYEPISPVIFYRENLMCHAVACVLRVHRKILDLLVRRL